MGISHIEISRKNQWLDQLQIQKIQRIFVFFSEFESLLSFFKCPSTAEHSPIGRPLRQIVTMGYIPFHVIPKKRADVIMASFYLDPALLLIKNSF